MTPTPFPEANANFGPPSDLEESQCATVRAYFGTIERGSLEGSKIVVVAHLPTADELADIMAGKPIFLSMLGGLAPHFLTTNFQSATSVA